MSPYSAAYRKALVEHAASAQCQLGSTCSKMLVQPNEVHTSSSSTTEPGPFLGPKTALNDLFHANSALSEFTESLSVDSPEES